LHAALEQLQPDIVLVEGPPDAQEVLPLLTHEQMQPPVALIIYAPEEPKRAVYYPFTHFSPEWQALRYGLEHQIPARFMDLPQAIQLAKTPIQPEATAPLETDAPDEQQTTTSARKKLKEAQMVAPNAQEEESAEDVRRTDPLALLAEAAGYSDHELWWEEQIEQRRDMTNLFEGILEAMTALRADTTPKDEEEAQREAYMRQTIRAAQKEGFERIAVVCGAWHAPVLVSPGPAKADAALLNGLKKLKVSATWIPWTNSRLSYRSGYGAGVTSPGWYEHLWTAPDRLSIRWVTRAAHLLREQKIDVSSASVIEAVRLAEALSALRDRPMPGLAEMHEAIRTVLCNGDAAPMTLIHEKLEVGEKLGEVPSDAPAVPLQRDLEAKQRRLRLKPSTEIMTLDLDLRKETDRARSQLLHQLRLLNIPWGELQRVSGKSGTFHEIWRLQWQVEFAVAIIEANIWGNAVEAAATAFACHKAENTEELPALSELLDQVILSVLPEAIDRLLSIIQKRAAVSADVQHLMGALPPLARVARYGDVRQTKADQILPVIDGLFERIVIGLPGACSSLDDDAAQKMVSSIDKVQECVGLLNRDEQRGEWQETLRQLMEKEGIHGLLRGRCCRLLLEQRVLDEEELQRLTRLALSTAVPAPQAAAWVEGVLRGSGMLVLHQDGLWRALDHWMSDLTAETFEALLPILRRAFSSFQAPERRAMGEKVKRLSTSSTHAMDQPGSTHEQEALHQERAMSVLPVLAQIMGVNLHGN
jgi:hypothetical protein